MRRVRIWVVTLAVISVILLYVLSPRLLMVQSQLKPADAIVVLGGESGERVFRAAELFQEGLSQLVVVAGSGDCTHYQRRLRLAGTTPEQILLECESRNTKENAQFSVEILRERGVREAIIVTTWWHTARAMNCFEHYAPEIEFLALPAYHGGKEPEPSIEQFVEIMIEYIKTVWYAVRYRIY